MLVIPAVDIMRGRCVRLVKGDPSRSKVYYDNPVAAAKRWVDEGADWLHIVDLDGALGTGENVESIIRITGEVQRSIEVGGGIRSIAKTERFLSMGISRIVMGTACIKNPELLDEAVGRFGRGRVAAALDVRVNLASIEGWTKSTTVNYLAMAQSLEARGVGAIIFTSVDRDGTMSGPAMKQVEALVRLVNVPIIASGGVSTLKELERLREVGASGVILGTSLYEGKISLRRAIKVATRC